MSNSTEKIFEEIEAYLQHKMPEKEIILFEERLKTDAALKELMALYDSVDVVLGKKQERFVADNTDEKKEMDRLLESDVYKNIANNLKAVNDEYQIEKQRKNGFMRYLYIATSSVAALLIVFFILKNNFGNDTMDTYYNDYANWETFPSLIEKSDTNKEASKIEILYRAHKYKDVIAHIPKDKTQEVNKLLYLGASYFKLQEYKEAHKVFDKIIASNSIDNSKGYWYKLLLFLKQKDIVKAKKMIAIIKKDSNNYNYAKAVQLSKKLEKLE